MPFEPHGEDELRTRVWHHVDDGVLTVDKIAYLLVGFLAGGLTVGLLVLWWLR